MRAAPDAPTSFGARRAGPVLLVASLFWAGGGLISRAAPISGPGLAFWRCVLGAICYHAVLLITGRRPSLAALRDSALGGLGFGLSIVCIFIANKTTTLVSAAVIGSLQPLVLGLVTHLTTQKVARVLWASTFAATAGTIIVVLGSAGHAGTWSLRGDLFAVGAVAANIVYVIGTKRARRTRSPLEYQASMLVVGAVVVLPIALLASDTTFFPTVDAWWWIAGLVVVGGTGHLLFSLAQHHVTVAASSAIMMTEILGIAVGGAVFFDQSITPVQLLGMAVVAGAVGVWIARDPGDATEHATALEIAGA